MEEHAENLDLCRLIILVKSEADCEQVVKLIQNTVKTREPQPITGFLLIRSEYMIYLLESTEDNVFQSCNEVFVSNSEIFVHVKCVDLQNSVKNRLFNKWYTRKIPIYDSKEIGETKDLQDNRETIETFRKTVAANLYELFQELSNACISRNHDKFIKQLDVLSKEGSKNIPDKTIMELILCSNHSYDLLELTREYCNVKMPHEFDECTSISDIIKTIKFDLSNF